MSSLPYIRLIMAISLLISPAYAQGFPFAKGTFLNNELQHWTLEEVRVHRDKAIGELKDKESVAEKDNAANSDLLGYWSKQVEGKKIEEQDNSNGDDPEAVIFKTVLDLTNYDGFVDFAMQVDDEATLTVTEIPTGEKATGDAPITESYEVKGTALWRVNRSYKEFSNSIPAGRKYDLILNYLNTANLTDKYDGLVDYDGVNVFLMHHPAVDLDVDSNNDEGFDFKWGSDFEDKMEADPSLPGKIIAVPIEPDADHDGIPDYKDFGGITPGPEKQFVQMVVHLPPDYDPETATVTFGYPMSATTSGSPTETPNSGFRIWTKNGHAVRSLNAIPDVTDPASGYLVKNGDPILWKNLAANCEKAEAGRYPGPALILYLETVITYKGGSLSTSQPEQIKVIAKNGSTGDESKTEDVVNITVRCTGGVKLSGVKALLVNDDDDYGDDKWDKDNDRAGILDDEVKFFTVTATALDQPIKVMIDSDQLFTSTNDPTPTAPGGLIDGVYPGKRLTNGAETGSDINGQSKIDFQPQVYTISVPANTTIVENLFIEGLKNSAQLDDVVITAEIDASGIYAGKIPCLATTDAEHSLTVYQVDLDIDSNNTEGHEFAEGGPNEDPIENSDAADKPGKAVIAIDVLDGNGDNIPDYENGVDGKPIIKGAKFTPMLLALPEPYDPASVSIILTYDEAKSGTSSPGPSIRIWRKDGDSNRIPADDLISSGHPRTWAELGGSTASRQLKLYVEAPNMTGVPRVGKMGIKASATQSGMATAEDLLKVSVMALGVVKLDNKPTTKLSVGTMENALTESGTLNIFNDAECFFIRLRGGAALNRVSLKIATGDNPDESYNDDPTEIRFDQLSGDDQFSFPQLLVSDDIDDDYSGGGVGADESINDRTHKVQLGGKVYIESLIINDKEQSCYLNTEVPVHKKVEFSVVILNRVVTRQSVEQDLKLAKERYAQIGILLEASIKEYTSPAGVNLNDGINTVAVDPATGKIKVANEARALIEYYGTEETNADIHVFYVGYHGMNDDSGKQLPAVGVALAEFAVRPADIGYTYNLLIRNDRKPFTLAHELGHLLTNNGHYGPGPKDSYNGSTPSVLNLLRDETSETNIITGSKRINEQQRKMFYENTSRVKNN